MAHTMDEGQVIAYWEATASEYDATDNPHVISEALLSIAAATPELYRGAMEAAAKAVGLRFCPHGNKIPGPLPEIKDVKDRQAAARAHAGLCGRHHAHHIAHIDLDAADARAGGEATTSKNLRNQVSFAAVTAPAGPFSRLNLRDFCV